MAETHTSSGGSPVGQLRVLSHELSHVPDLKLLQITQLIDRMPERGQADLLLEPVRSRLAALRPLRPMSRTRLLFTPFDPVMVAAGSWRPGEPSIPRSIIRPLSALILSRTGNDVEQSVLPAGVASDDAALTRRGAPFWTEMAQQMATLELPEHWGAPAWQAEHGFSRAMLSELLPVLALVLAHAVELRTLPPPADPACEPVISSLLAAAAPTGLVGWGIMLALLLEASAPARVTAAATALAQGSRLAAALQAGIDRATADALDRMEGQIDQAAPGALLGPHEIEVRLTLIDRIESFRRLEHRPAPEQRRVGQLRQALATTNRQLFERTLQARLAAATGAEPVRTLEADAREMRRFALAAARLGDSDQYARLLGEAAARLAGGTGTLSPVDHMRLTELLIGSDQAARLYGLA